MNYKINFINNFTTAGLIIALIISGCSNEPLPKKIAPKELKLYKAYIRKGREAYKQKNNINNFSESIRYYDSALAIAENYDIDTLKEWVYQNIGKSFEAWNQQPDKTVYYYKKAIQYGLKCNDFPSRLGWLQIILAESYNKAHDTLNTIKTIKECDQYLTRNLNPGNDTLNNYYTELAFIAAKVKNYSYSLYLSKKVANPDNVVNERINYKSHQTLTRCLLHLYYLHSEMPAWIDSTKKINVI